MALLSTPAHQQERGWDTLNKDDAFRRLADRLYTCAFDWARAAAGAVEPLGQRLDRVLGAKLELTQQLFRDSPHAPELMGENARLSADLDAAFVQNLVDESRPRQRLRRGIALLVRDRPGHRATALRLARRPELTVYATARKRSRNWPRPAAGC